MFAYSSWTSITWIVIVGSSLVMMLWIVIYSLLPVNTFSNTDGFIDEVEILFSNVTFWTTVVFSILVALGESKWYFWRPILTDNRLAPRFLTKFFKLMYMPCSKVMSRHLQDPPQVLIGRVLITMTQMLSSWSPRPLYRIPTTRKIVSRPVPLTTRHLTSLPLGIQCHQRHAQTPNARQQVLTWRKHSRTTPGRQRYEKDERRHSLLLFTLLFSLAHSACRLGSGWGVAVRESIDPPSSSSHADPSCCPPFGVCESIDPPSTSAMLIEVVVTDWRVVDNVS
jgi:hypothetical protein